MVGKALDFNSPYLDQLLFGHLPTVRTWLRWSRGSFISSSMERNRVIEELTLTKVFVLFCFVFYSSTISIHG